MGAPIHYPEPPTAPAPSGPPDPRTLLSAWRLALQPARLVAATTRLRDAPRGSGEPVVLIPGFRAPEGSVVPLARYLRWLGHDAVTWGFGTNQGDLETRSRFQEQVVARAERRQTPISLVGWSLGGVYAREVARHAPEHVRRVITYGSPVEGGALHTLFARTLDPAKARASGERSAQRAAGRSIDAPVTAIFTRRDAIVCWTACIDRHSPRVEHVEVGSTHTGMGIDPDVWHVVATRLASGASTPPRREAGG